MKMSSKTVRPLSYTCSLVGLFFLLETKLFPRAVFFIASAARMRRHKLHHGAVLIQPDQKPVPEVMLP